MSKKKNIIFSSAVVLILLVGFLINVKNGKTDEIEVQTAQVKRGQIIETVNATGRIQPKTQVKISADVAAKITHLEVEEGDWVEKGTLLVELDKENYRAAVESAEANRRSNESNALLAKENMLKTQKDFERTKELFAKDLESQATLDQMSAAYQVEKARYQSTLDIVAQAEASLKQAKDNFSKTTIYAPMSGTISELNKEVGEIALGSQFQEDVILIVSDLAGMEAEVNVDENDIVSVSLGDTATIEVDALPDVKFKGIVSEIASSATITGNGTADQKTEFEVTIAVLEPGERLRPGMTASADVITDIKENVLNIPIQSVALRTVEQLQEETEGDSGEAIADDLPKSEYTPDKDGFVQVAFVIEDGVSLAKQVITGIQSENDIEITNGLGEDEDVVIGSYRAISKDLQNGTEVIIGDGKKDEK